MDAAGDWHDSSQQDWLMDMAAIGLEDLAVVHWGMGSGGRLNMSAKALCRSCTSLVLALPLGGLALLLASMMASCCVCWMICWVLGDTVWVVMLGTRSDKRVMLSLWMELVVVHPEGPLI